MVYHKQLNARVDNASHFEMVTIRYGNHPPAAHGSIVSDDHMESSCFVLPTGELISLTPRQLVALQHVAAGHSDKETAAAMAIATKSVKHHLCAVYDALRVHNRTEAVMVAMWADIVIPPLPARTPDRLTKPQRQRITRRNRAA